RASVGRPSVRGDRRTCGLFREHRVSPLQRGDRLSAPHAGCAMSEPVSERLSRFTPDASGLDRDALLFEAGRASARPSWRWKGLAAALAASQLLTLWLLWPASQPPAHSVPAPSLVTPPVS